jgi:hypothetical protein
MGVIHTVMFRLAQKKAGEFMRTVNVNLPASSEFPAVSWQQFPKKKRKLDGKSPSGVTDRGGYVHTFVMLGNARLFVA